MQTASIILNQQLPIDLNLVASNGGGSYKIPKGTLCKVKKYEERLIIVYVPLSVYKQNHPHGNGLSFNVGKTNPQGVIIGDTCFDWSYKESPTWGKQIDNPQYISLLKFIEEEKTLEAENEYDAMVEILEKEHNESIAFIDEERAYKYDHPEDLL